MMINIVVSVALDPGTCDVNGLVSIDNAVWEDNNRPE